LLSTDKVVIRVVDASVAKDFAKAWSDLGLAVVSAFTSDDKKQTLLYGTGEPEAIAVVAALLPPEPKGEKGK